MYMVGASALFLYLALISETDKKCRLFGFFDLMNICPFGAFFVSFKDDMTLMVDKIKGLVAR